MNASIASEHARCARLAARPQSTIGVDAWLTASRCWWRLLELCGAFALLFLALPILLTAAFAICVDSRGPALYRQTRVGRAGKAFEIYKLRTMHTDAEIDGRPRFATRSDPRITRVGGFLRRARIDELPQLLNVVRGDMSFIGPRPERPHFVQEYRRQIPGYAQRLAVKPGLTGLAQVRYRYTDDVAGTQCKLGYDLYYVRHRTLFLDLRILLATVHVVMTGRGAT
jgi:lipopolysaccharide/colanic/teichoic acid biosynthesis glycosyltransferase